MKNIFKITAIIGLVILFCGSDRAQARRWSPGEAATRARRRDFNLSDKEQLLRDLSPEWKKEHRKITREIEAGTRGRKTKVMESDEEFLDLEMPVKIKEIRDTKDKEDEDIVIKEKKETRDTTGKEDENIVIEEKKEEFNEVDCKDYEETVSLNILKKINYVTLEDFLEKNIEKRDKMLSAYTATSEGSTKFIESLMFSLIAFNNETNFEAKNEYYGEIFNSLKQVTYQVYCAMQRENSDKSKAEYKDLFTKILNKFLIFLKDYNQLRWASDDKGKKNTEFFNNLLKLFQK